VICLSKVGCGIVTPAGYSLMGYVKGGMAHEMHCMTLQKSRFSDWINKIFSSEKTIPFELIKVSFGYD
jgi:hypothetical protein